MPQRPHSGGIFPTLHAIEEKAAKLRRSYKKRRKTHKGSRPKKGLFILVAACLLFKQKYPERKTGFSELALWIQREYGQKTKYDFDMKKLYKWMKGMGYKEMLWEEAWQDIRIVQDISRKGAGEKEMSRRDIQIMHSISKQDLKDLTGFILSIHSGNKKISNKFIFDRPA